MKLRSLLIVLAAIALVLLSAAAAGAVWIAANSPVEQLQTLGRSQLDAAALFVSRQSPLVVSLGVNPDRLESVDLLSVPASQRSQRRSEWAEWQQSLFVDTQLNYQRDIQPWLGDQVVLAITTPDVDRDSGNGAQVGYLFAFTPQDSTLASQTLQRFWQRHAKAKDRITETYAGVRITYQRSAQTLTTATAVVSDRIVLVANSPKVLRDAINTVQVGQSLTDSDAYQQAIENLPENALGFAYVNLPQLSTWLTRKPESPSQFRIYDRLLATLDRTPTGWVADTLLLSSLDNPLTPAKPTLSAPVDALRFVPAASTVVAAGNDVQQFWTQLQTGLAGYENLTELLRQPVAQLQQQWVVPLPDLLSWMTGDYAIALLPNPENRSQSDWLFATRRSPDLVAGLDKLNAIAQDQGVTIGALPLETPLGTQEIFAWTKLSTRSHKTAGKSLVSLDAQVQGVHTAVEDYEIFATSLEAIAQALQAPEDSLLKSAKFQTAIAPFETPNDGYFYVDQTVVQQALSRTPLIDRTPLSRLLKQALSLGATSYGKETIGQRGAVHLGE
ncbi:DUF3352 domain-containing protein [Phormidium tenue FACHB-886]|nr:DUF3352 domain-containing protein [Phormidium tenue FACHB-886]